MDILQMGPEVSGGLTCSQIVSASRLSNLRLRFLEFPDERYNSEYERDHHDWVSLSNALINVENPPPPYLITRVAQWK